MTCQTQPAEHDEVLTENTICTRDAKYRQVNDA